MLLTRQNDRYEAITTFDERSAPKEAGFRWDPALKRWWTPDVERAERLFEFADDRCKEYMLVEKQARLERIEESKRTDAEIDVRAPDGLDYLPYQRAGIAYATQRPATIIADEMGLGKTIQAIGVLNSDASIRNVLVICPASLRINWKRELRKWLVRDMSMSIWKSKSSPAADIVIINYDILHRHTSTLRARRWDLMIVDEAHYLKNPTTRRTKQVLGSRSRNEPLDAIPAKRKLYLTGTPIVNRPIEIHPILRSIDKSWGSKMSFGKRYCGAHHNGFGWDFTGSSNLDELQDRLRSSCMVRRLKKDVLKELPAKRRQIIELPANGMTQRIAKEAREYEAFERDLDDLRAMVELAKASESQEDYEAAVKKLRSEEKISFDHISNMRKETAIAKAGSVAEYALEMLETVDKLVIFAHHHEVIDRLESRISQAFHVVKLDGRDSMKERDEAVSQFQEDPQVRVFIGGIAAAGVGLTLTAASTILLAELDWVPGNMSQAEDRCHRIGQESSVLVQHVVLEGSIDAIMAHTIIGKQRVIDHALDDQTADPEKIELSQTCVTRGVQRSLLAEEAETIDDEETRRIHSKLRIIAGMCDGATTEDARGFNKLDTRIGKSLAACQNLTPRQAALAKRLVHKYRRQLA